MFWQFIFFNGLCWSKTTTPSIAATEIIITTCVILPKLKCFNIKGPKKKKRSVKQVCAWEFLCLLFIPEVDRPTDACEEGTHTCDIPERAQCSYRGGSSYVCSCLPGFIGDGRICEGTASGEGEYLHEFWRQVSISKRWSQTSDL